MLLKELSKVLDLSSDDVVLFSGDEIARYNCIGNYADQRVDSKVHYDFCEVLKVELGIVKGVDDKATLNILIKEKEND